MAASRLPGVMLFQGTDQVLLAEAVRKAAHDALGDTDASLALEELDETNYADEDGDYSIAPLVDAAQTAPFLTDRRVVIGHHLARFSTQDAVKPLIAYVENPLDTTTLILAWSKGPKLSRAVGGVPKKLLDALKAAGGAIEKVDVGTGRAANAWFADRLGSAAVKFDGPAKAFMADHLGEDASRLGAILNLLESSFGAGTKLTVEDIRPFVGDAGGVPPWELTDAIDSGSIPDAIAKLHRMMHAGERHPLALMATLQSHFGRIMALDGAGVANEKDAAAILGMKGSTFPAKKALRQSQRLGTERTKEAIRLLAVADLDLRGQTALDPEATMEVLVARLTRLSR